VLVYSSPPAAAKGYQKLLGHQIEPPVPSLFTFNVLDDRLDLAGVSVESAVEVVGGWKDPVGADWTIALLTGVCGPAVLKLSAWVRGCCTTATIKQLC